MTYLDKEATVIYKAKDGKDTKVFPALEWLANLCSHIPNRVSRWRATMAITATSPEGKDRWREGMTRSPASSKHRVTRRHSGATGHA